MRALLFAAICWLPMALAAAQEGAGQAPAGKEQAAPGALAADPNRVTTADVQSMIDNLGTIQETDLSGAQAKRLYQLALELLQEEQQALADAQGYQQILAGADKEVDSQKAEIRKYEAERLPSPAELFRWRQLKPDELEHELSAEEARLVELKGELATVQAQVSSILSRPAKLREELGDAKARLQKVQLALQSDQAKDAVGRAGRVRKQAEVQKLTAQIRKLNLEQISLDDRLKLAQLRAKALEAQIAAAEGDMQQLKSLHDAQLRIQGVQARRQAEEIRREAAGKHPLVQKTAQRNAELAIKRSEAASRLERISRRLQSVNEMALRLDRDYRRTLAEVEVGGSSASIGRFLYRQREELMKLIFSELYGQRPKNLKRQLLEVQDERFAVEDELTKLRDGELSAESLIGEYAKTDPDWLSLSVEERTTVRQEVARLLNDRVTLLEGLDKYERALAARMKDLAQALEQLQKKGRDYSRFLSQQQWLVPSNPAVGPEWLAQLHRAVGNLLSLDLWARGAGIFMEAWDEAPWMGIAALLAWLGLLLRRPAFKRRLKSIAGEVGRFYSDRFSLTVQALLITVLLALPLPLLVGGLHLMFLYSSDLPVRGLVSAQLAILSVELFGVVLLQALFVRHGMMEAHLRLKKETINKVRRNLAWWTPMEIVGLFGIVLTRLQGGSGLYYDTIGMPSFVMVALATAVFLWRILQPSAAPPAAAGQAEEEKGRPHRIWWVTLVTAFIVLLALLAMAGYYYSASVLGALVGDTLWIGGAGVLSYQLSLRWQKLAKSRLARARAWRRFEEARRKKEGREAAEAAGEALPELQDHMEMDIEDVDARIKSLLRMVHILVFGGAVVWLWHSFYPVGGLLEGVELWQRVARTPAGEQLVPVTLKDLLIAVMIGALAWSVARNLPALLELVLEPFKLGSGNRYAVTQVLVYLVYVIGVVLVMNLFGVSWGDLQWLVAALGVGIGFGLKEIFANLISGIILLFEQPIRVGDAVTVGNVSGIVSRIQVRATTITDWDNKELIIPNQTLIIEPVINWTLTSQVTRLTFTVGIAYGSDTEKALQVMTDTVRSCPHVLEEPPPTIFFIGFGDSSLDFEVRVFVENRQERMPVMHLLHMELEKALRENGIEIPFPQRDLHLRSVDEEIDFARSSPAGA